MKSISLFILLFSAMALGATNQYSGILSVGDSDSHDSIFIWNEAELDMDGGTVQSLDMFNFSTADISGGSITQGVYVWDDITIDISDGDIGWNLDASDDSTVNLHGGTIDDWLYATDNSVVNIYGYDFDYDPDAGGWNGGQLTGLWMDATPLTIDFLDNIAVDSTYYDHVNLVPEPTTLLLLTLGAVMLRKRR